MTGQHTTQNDRLNELSTEVLILKFKNAHVFINWPINVEKP